MEENISNIYNGRFLAFIDKEGELFIIENKKGNNYNHCILFSRMDFLLKKNLFDDLSIPPFKCGGYDLSNHCSNKGYIVVWPSLVSSDEHIIVSLPKQIQEKQLTTFINLQKELEKNYINQDDSEYNKKNILYKKSTTETKQKRKILKK